MQIKIWGVRGSIPAPPMPQDIEILVKQVLLRFVEGGFQAKNQLNEFIQTLPRHGLGGYGGNTPCVEVRSPSQRIIIDGGSGVRNLGYELMNGPAGQGEAEIHLFFTHFHWDHLMGLPFFTPLFIPGNRIHVYSVQAELLEVFETIFRKPYFPVPLSQLKSTIQYHRLEPRKLFQVGDIAITPYQLDHPDPCWGYKIERKGKVYSHCVDTECTRVSREQLGLDLPLYQGVDLMLFDAQYTLMETIEKVNWGHAAASLGLDIAMREKIKRVFFMHHDPASSNEKIAAAEAQARRYYKSQLKAAQRQGEPLHPVEWAFAHEGQILEV